MEPATGDGYVLVVPFFDVEEFEDFQILRGSAGPRAAADAFNAVCEDVGRRFDVAPAPISLVGFSAGLNSLIGMPCAFRNGSPHWSDASAGWYTMPDAQLAFRMDWLNRLT
jgi:hypothetical protein